MEQSAYIRALIGHETGVHHLIDSPLTFVDPVIFSIDSLQIVDAPSAYSQPGWPTTGPHLKRK